MYKGRFGELMEKPANQQCTLVSRASRIAPTKGKVHQHLSTLIAT